MKHHSKTILLFLTFAFVIGMSLATIASKSFTASSSFDLVADTNTEFPGDSNETESSESGPTVFSPNDLSSAFNESGYMKSSSVSMDGKEMINDFNGNLIYTIPIAQGKGLGDLSYDVNLTYNGNVNYQVMTSNYASLFNGGAYRSYTISAPGWIYSFNGFAVQMLNFETGIFTNPVSGQASGNNVHLLATGYDLTDYTNSLSYSNPVQYDKITIMLGDGSTQILENKNATHSFETEYTGIYKSPEKNSNIYAKVEYITGTNEFSYAGTPRRMHLMKGDGLEYIFEEQTVHYTDLTTLQQNTISSRLRQNVFILKAVKDRFGHVMELSYGGYGWNENGRPWVAGMPGASFSYPDLWGNHPWIFVTTPDGTFKFRTDTWGNYNTENHRPRLLSYANPSGEEASFNYAPYRRSAINLYGTPLGSSNNVPSLFQIKLKDAYPLYRLSGINEVTQSGTLKRKYYYKAGSEDLTMNHNTDNSTGAPITAHSDTDYYLGEGRDLFYSNMLDSSIITSNEDRIRKEQFSYEYHVNRNTDSLFIQPIDRRDDYISRRWTISANSKNLFDTPSINQSIKLYRNFRIKEHTDNEGFKSYEGSIKLLEDSLKSGSDNALYKIMNYTYDLSNSSPYSVVSGTLLESAVEENFNGIKRKTQYSYEGGGDNNLISKMEIDPLNRKTVTNYTSINIDNFVVYKFGSHRIPEYLNSYDTVNIYINNIPTEVKIYSVNDTLIQKKDMIYASLDTLKPVTDSTIIPKGYPAQLWKERDIDPHGGAVLRETVYSYYNKDTTGMNMIANQNPANLHEGCLSQITMPDGKKIRYYYDLISREEEENRPNCDGGGVPDSNVAEEYACAPKLSFHKLYDNGADSLLKSSWGTSFISLPSRIDRYIDGSRYLTTYQQYNGMGAPTQIVNENNFLTQLDYDRYYRLGALTLPYDFNDSLAHIDTVINSHFEKIEIVSSLVQGGTISDNDTSTMNLEYDQIGFIDKYLENEISGPGGPGSGGDPHPNHSQLIKFQDTSFSHIMGIDSAFLEIDPYSITVLEDNVNHNSDHSLVIRPLDQLDHDHYGYYHNRAFHYGTGSLIISNPDVSSYFSCRSSDSLIGQYNANRMKINVKDLLLQNHDTIHGLQIQGLDLDLDYDELISATLVQLDMRNEASCLSTAEYLNLFRPVLRIYAKYKTQDTTINTIYKNGTMIYSYSDVGDSVQIKNKLYKSGGNNVYKTTSHFFDELGRLYKTKQYTGPGTANEIQTGYNYLDQKAKTIDATGDTTKFSYDKYGNLSKTGNADASNSYVNSIYTGTLTTAFYTLTSSFINRQEFIDETNRHYYKYFDAAGRLLRETKFVSAEEPESPDIFNPDSSYVSRDTPADLALNTDYRYDSLYRVNCVQTPAGKRIWYNYDNLGRQTKRITPDAGTTLYTYDINDNLITSQDANQRAIGTDVYTYRTYDGLNRLISIGETQTSNSFPDFTDAIDSEYHLDFSPSNSDLLTINVYDTLVQNSSNPFNSIFSNIPSNYFYSDHNNTKGALLATAFRTRRTDDWNYKFYRYDARGRVTVLFTYLDELGWKKEAYTYNSQNQVVATKYNAGGIDSISFANTYDLAGRLSKVNTYTTNNFVEPDYMLMNPGQFTQLAAYTYNKDSQIDSSFFMSGMPKTKYRYNNRNWVYSINTSGSSTNPFSEAMTYNANGNINMQALAGSYKDYFDNTDDLAYHYIYDKSNRLLKADQLGSTEPNMFTLTNTYDEDGNITHLTRYEDNKTPTDDFSYEYQSGTNKLLRVTNLLDDDYEYDANGNLTKDNVNEVWDMKYDFRNLLLSCTSKNIDVDDPLNGDKIYYAKYYYDEAGNRICKSIWEYTGSSSHPSYPAGSWISKMTEFYVHNLSGAEVAVYAGYEDLKFWNILGTDNVGRINVDGSKQFYIKDHLGSVRCVIAENSDVISAQDFDAWGHKMDGRKYESGTQSKYQFTSKERDIESDFDYFGARYYDSRIGRWGGVEPLYDKYANVTPYCYSINNPVIVKDADGRDAKVSIDNTSHIITVTVDVYYVNVNDYHHKNAIGDETANNIEKSLKDAQDDWNNAGADVELDGQNYTVKFSFNLNRVKEFSQMEQYNKFGDTEGNNYLIYEAEGMNPSVINGNRLHLVSGEGLKFPENWFDHEIGHLLGLSHPAEGAKNSNDVMGYRSPHHKPQSSNVKRFLKKVDLKKENQISKGARRELESY